MLSLGDVSRLKELEVKEPPEPFPPVPEGLSLEELFAQKYYPQAVSKASEIIHEHAQDFNHESIDEVNLVAQAWLIRFKSLVVLHRGAQVADEARTLLNDLDTVEASVLERSQHLWDLKLLLVPVYSRGINQNAIQRLYAITVDAREALSAATSPEARSTWEGRIRDLSFHVTAILVAIRDYISALAHLSALFQVTKDSDAVYACKVAQVTALVYLQAGDVNSAREWLALDQDHPGVGDPAIRAVVAFADGEDILFEGPGVLNTRAMALLYQGKIDQAIEVLEKVVTSEESCAGAHSNLFMLYDLYRGDPAASKRSFAQNMVDAGHKSLGRYDLFKE